MHATHHRGVTPNNLVFLFRVHEVLRASEPIEAADPCGPLLFNFFVMAKIFKVLLSMLIEEVRFLLRRVGVRDEVLLNIWQGREHFHLSIVILCPLVD